VCRADTASASSSGSEKVAKSLTRAKNRLPSITRPFFNKFFDLQCRLKLSSKSALLDRSLEQSLRVFPTAGRPIKPFATLIDQRRRSPRHTVEEDVDFARR